MSHSQVEIVENAGRLAADLQSGTAITKTAFLAVVSTFISDPSGDLNCLRRTMALLREGSGGHLKRGGGFGDQVRVVIREVARLLEREEWQPKELKSLFGWTARLLLVRAEANQSGGAKPSDSTERRQSSRPAPSFGAIAGKNRKVLEMAATQPATQQVASPKSFEEKLRDRVRPIGFQNADREVPRLLDELTGEEQRLAAQAIIEHLGRKALKEKTRRDKEWVRKLFTIETSNP